MSPLLKPEPKFPSLSAATATNSLRSGAGNSFRRVGKSWLTTLASAVRRCGRAIRLRSRVKCKNSAQPGRFQLRASRRFHLEFRSAEFWHTTGLDSCNNAARRSLALISRPLRTSRRWCKHKRDSITGRGRTNQQRICTRCNRLPKVSRRRCRQLLRGTPSATTTIIEVPSVRTRRTD